MRENHHRNNHKLRKNSIWDRSGVSLVSLLVMTAVMAIIAGFAYQQLSFLANRGSVDRRTQDIHSKVMESIADLNNIILQPQFGSLSSFLQVVNNGGAASYNPVVSVDLNSASAFQSWFSPHLLTEPMNFANVQASITYTIELWKFVKQGNYLTAKPIQIGSDTVSDVAYMNIKAVITGQRIGFPTPILTASGSVVVPR